MRFKPGRWQHADQAVVAGLIADRRRSRIIALSDWESAKDEMAMPGRLDKAERAELSGLSVSDEVIRKVAESWAPPRPFQWKKR